MTFGIELGARHVRAVAVDEAGRVVARGGRRASNGALAKTAKAVVQALAKSAGGPASAAGICAFDPDDPGARAAADAIGSVTAVTSAGATIGLAAVTAEIWVGAARGCRHAVALVIGDHISAGIVIDGRLWRGAHGAAGSAGWLALNPVERQDYRREGCLDAEVSARGVARRLVWRIQAGDHSTVLENAGDLEAITAEHVYDGARARDGVAISVVRDTARYIGMAVANMVTMLDPEIVVLAGEVSRAGDLLLDSVRQECARRLPLALAGHYRLDVSPLAEDAPAIGAARLAAP
jgi:glucokinase